MVTAPDWHDELVLVAELASVNNQIARFVLRLLDADAGRRAEMAVGDEYGLGGRLVDLGHALQDRATYRGRRDGGVDILVDLNGDGRADFIGHDKDRDWTVDSADYDKDHDGVFEKRMYDDDGDGLLDRSVRRR